ncbi:unnamed protein product [Taenia asiatica]|uniref:Mannosyltransferase n=1 Tax=Taenia asiatica TaxID=60517 RepID=A0A0R3VTT2_TAEAS|nr:unnamed protein product [Taenia asiatica]
MFALDLKLGILAALCSTVWNNINDCDETFNYLEPLGFIISTTNNTGFQTWEYSPQFGLRSYLYLWIIGWPAYILVRFGLPGWLQFLGIRLFLSLVSVLSSSLLANSSSLYLYPDNSFKRFTFKVIFCLIHSFAPGSFISASSSVPSALAASMTSLMLSTWINGQYFYSVGAVAVSTIVVWPFSVVLGVPLALFLIASGMIAHLIVHSIFWALALITPMVLIDTFYYGGLMCSTWNIISYNALSSLQGRSLSQLYGTETAAYYVLNYFLNYNIAIVFVATFTVPVFICVMLRIGWKTATDFHRRAFKLLCIALTPLLMWNVVFSIQSHKEERFLFPCFPCLDLLITLLLCVLFFNHSGKSVTCLPFSVFVVMSFLLLFIGLSFSRILALTQGYSAPMYLVQHLPVSNASKTLCIGRDWHHFPSHFLLPRENHGWRVHFLRSNFSGQLPGKFAEGVGVLEATRSPSSHFNDMNLPEEGTFFNIEKCDYILDRLSKPGENEVQYSADTRTWRILLTRPILERTQLNSNATESLLQKAFTRLQRAFFIPYLFKLNNIWKDMHTLERIKSV